MLYVIIFFIEAELEDAVERALQIILRQYGKEEMGGNVQKRDYIRLL